MVRHHAIQPGHTIATGPDGRVWFSVAGDAFFLRPGSELRLRPAGALDTAVEALRLVSGALGATFRRGVRRTVHTPTVTIGIRGTGIYLEATPQETYARGHERRGHGAPHERGDLAPGAPRRPAQPLLNL
jgi:hypothetical protein